MFKKIKRNLLNKSANQVLSWNREAEADDSDSFDIPLIYRISNMSKNLDRYEYFLVNDYERALFYNQGELHGGVLTGGLYQLKPEAKKKGSEIIWFDVSLIKLKWGFPMEQGIPTKEGVEVGLYGDLTVQITDPLIFYQNLVSGKKRWTKRDLKSFISSILLTSLRDIFKHYSLKSILTTDREVVKSKVYSKLSQEFMNFGIDLETFNILGENTPENVENLKGETLHHELSVSDTNIELFQRLKSTLVKKYQRQDELQAQKQTFEDNYIAGSLSKKDYEAKMGILQNLLTENTEEIERIKLKMKKFSKEHKIELE
jgi:membrane protease subunit (stomatin/prohibitin family)